MRGGEAMANVIHVKDSFKLGDRADELDVITNGKGQFLCVRANSDEDINDTAYWMVISQGKPGRDGKDGVDGKSVSLEVSDDGKWIINGHKTEQIARGPAGSMGVTSDITASQDLNSLRTNGFYYADHVTVHNSPFEDSSKVGFFLQVIASNGGNALQQLTDMASASVWIRTFDSKKWTDWRMITQWNQEDQL